MSGNHDIPVTIDITLSWTVAAKIYTTVLRDGTTEGKDEAQRELIKMGQMMDILAEACRQGTAQAYADAALTIHKMQSQE